MKKIIFLLVWMFFIVDFAGAKDEVKKYRPDFFVPDTIDFYAPEKIPNFRIRNVNNVNTIKKETTNIIKEESENKSAYQTKNVPPYKSKYNEYINDIMAYYSSGEMPRNVLLEKDLAEMNSNEPIEANFPAPTELTSQEMSDFYELYQRLLNN